jgi:glucose-1-phosphate thymidylyltransferase
VNPSSQREIIGIIPAGGRGTRLGPLPCSKELFPVEFQEATEGAGLHPKPIGQHLLEHFRRAGAEQALFVIRKGKWDIPEYFGDGSSLGMSIGYLIMNLPYGAPYTIDQAYPFVREANIVFGFPDMLIEPEDTYPRTLEHLSATQADIVLGLFPTDQPQLCDPIEFDEQSRIRQIHVKPRQSDLRITWATAAWAPSFTQFLHEYLAGLEREAASQPSARPELYMSHVIMAAIQSGLRVEGLSLPGARFLDIGIPENLLQALRTQLDAR